MDENNIQNLFPHPFWTPSSAQPEIDQASNDSRLSRCIPETLPFPRRRLDTGNLLTTHNGRDQFSCPNGSYVLTDSSLLPAGGASRRLEFATPALTTTLIGDMGEPTSARQQVLQHMIHHTNTQPETHSSLTIGLGDWVYPRGPIDRSSLETERVRTTVLDAFEDYASHSPTYGILGNHEYGCHEFAGDIDYFMEMANKANIEFPGRYYSLELEGPDWTLDCFALDSSVLASDPDQVSWFQTQVQNSVAKEKDSQHTRWRAVFAHHPLQSHGLHHGETTYLRDLLSPGLTDIDLYACGHEHHLEYLVEPGLNEPAVLLTGTSCDTRAPRPSTHPLFSSSNYGFATMTVSHTALDIQFHTLSHSEPTADPVTSVEFHRKIAR